MRQLSASQQRLLDAIQIAVREFLSAEGIVESTTKTGRKANITVETGLFLVTALSAYLTYWVASITHATKHIPATNGVHVADEITLAQVEGAKGGLAKFEDDLEKHGPAGTNKGIIH